MSAQHHRHAPSSPRAMGPAAEAALPVMVRGSIAARARFAHVVLCVAEAAKPHVIAAAAAPLDARRGAGELVVLTGHVSKTSRAPVRASRARACAVWPCAVWQLSPVPAPVMRQKPHKPKIASARIGADGGARCGLGRAMLRPGGLPGGSTFNSPQLSTPGPGRAVQPPQSALDSGTGCPDTPFRAVAGPFHEFRLRGGM